MDSTSQRECGIRARIHLHNSPECDILLEGKEQWEKGESPRAKGDRGCTAEEREKEQWEKG